MDYLGFTAALVLAYTLTCYIWFLQPGFAWILCLIPWVICLLTPLPYGCSPCLLVFLWSLPLQHLRLACCLYMVGFAASYTACHCSPSFLWFLPSWFFCLPFLDAIVLEVGGCWALVPAMPLIYSHKTALPRFCVYCYNTMPFCWISLPGWHTSLVSRGCLPAFYGAACSRRMLTMVLDTAAASALVRLRHSGAVAVPAPAPPAFAPGTLGAAACAPSGAHASCH